MATDQPNKLQNQPPHPEKIGIFGGTFDPIHHGHLILAREAKEELELDRMIFVPAAASPHKLNQIFAPAEVRLEMLTIALAGEAGFECSALELQRPPPSYAIDTVAACRLTHPTAEFFCVVGDDHLDRLSTWHRFEELSKSVQFVVLNRGGLSPGHPYPRIQRRLDISATDIRKRVATGRSIRYLVPPAVAEIIRNRQLYRESYQ